MSDMDMTAVSLSNPEFVLNKIKECPDLQAYLNKMYRIKQLEKQCEAIQQSAMEQFKQAFSGAKTVDGGYFKLQHSVGPSKFEFSDAVLSLKKQLSDLQKQEKKDGSAIVVPSDKEVIKITFNEEEIKSANSTESQ